MGIVEETREPETEFPWVLALPLLAAALAVGIAIGRVSMRDEVARAYDAGFDAGAKDATSEWGEWR